MLVEEAGAITGVVSEIDFRLHLDLTILAGHRRIASIAQRIGIEASFLYTLLDAIPALIWLKDVEGRYLACNHSFERFFGAVEKDSVGKFDYDCMLRAEADAC